MKTNKTVETRFDVRIKNAASGTWAAIASDIEASRFGDDEIALDDAVDCVSEHIEIHGGLSKDDIRLLRGMDIDDKRAMVRSAIESYF